MPGQTYSVQYVEGDGEIVRLGQHGERASTFYNWSAMAQMNHRLQELEAKVA